MQVAVGGDTHAVERELNAAHVLVTERAGERIVIHKYVEGVGTNGAQVVVAGDLHEIAGLGIRSGCAQCGQHTEDQAGSQYQRQKFLAFLHVCLLKKCVSFRFFDAAFAAARNSPPSRKTSSHSRGIDLQPPRGMCKSDLQSRCACAGPSRL